MEKYTVFSNRHLLFLSVYLNTNNKKLFFQIQILMTAKINPRQITEI